MLQKLIDAAKSLLRYVAGLTQTQPAADENSAPPNRPHMETVATVELRGRHDITEPLKRLQDDCTALGSNVGRESGRKDQQEPTLKFLEASATSMAETVWRRCSKLRQDIANGVVRRLTDELERLVEGTDVAAANLRDRKAERAALKPRDVRPTVSERLVRGATLGFLFSFAPSVHDLLPLSPALQWPAALVISFGVAQLLVEGILPHGPSAPTPVWFRHMAFIASLALGGAFLVIRLEAASSAVEYGLAYGLSLAEASVALLLKARASALQPHIDAWHDDENQRRLAESLIANAEGELKARQEDVRLTELKIERALDELERASVTSDLAALTKLAIEAVRHGYYAAIMANDASVRGLARKETANGKR